MSIKNNYLRETFFSEYKEKNSILILLFIIFSLTTYLIYWIYNTNKDFLKIDPNAPNPNRAISVLLILPSLWFLISYFFKFYYLHLNSKYLLHIYWNPNLNYFTLKGFFFGSFEFFIWTLIIFLILKYFYDFSITYAKITRTNFFPWYVFLSSEVFGFVFVLFGINILFVLSFFTIIAIPAMQEKLNIISNSIKLNQEKKINYMYGSNN